MKITLIGSFALTDQQKQRLKNLGEVTELPEPASSEEWLTNVQGADIICSDGSYLLENLYNLKNVFVTYPYIELGPFDSQTLQQNSVVIANTQGSNRDSIAEWVMFMILSLFRKFPSVLNITKDWPFELTQSLSGKKVLIIGKGNIGAKIGSLCEAFGMNVDYFTREDDLTAKSAGVDLVINALNCNSTSENLLDEKFFTSLNPGTYFVSFVRPFTYDIDGLLKALDGGIVAGAAIDCDPERPGDTSNAFYRKVRSNKKILVTPHVAFATAQARQNGAETLVQNVEAFIKGRPQNVLTKQ